MNVELIAYTPEPDMVCAKASQTCTSTAIPKGTFIMKKSLKHALASGHESVVEHASFTFAVSGVSRALTHQLVRHRVASYSQQSQRYVKMDEIKCITPKSVTDAIEAEWMNGGGWNPNGCLQSSLIEYNRCLKDITERMRELGIPEEDIRYFYPQGITTNIIVTMNARELRHFFALRCCNRAQWEIRELADKMLELVKPVAPTIFENAGPSCVITGRCPEGKKSCGRWKE